MAIVFNPGGCKHGRENFIADVPLAFKDKGAEDYFVKAGFATKTQKKALHTYPAGTVEVDPATVFGGGPNAGRKVLSNG